MFLCEMAFHVDVCVKSWRTFLGFNIMRIRCYVLCGTVSPSRTWWLWLLWELWLYLIAYFLWPCNSCKVAMQLYWLRVSGLGRNEIVMDVGRTAHYYCVVRSWMHTCTVWCGFQLDTNTVEYSCGKYATNRNFWNQQNMRVLIHNWKSVHAIN